MLKDQYWDEKGIREEFFARLFLLASQDNCDFKVLKDYLSQVKYELAELEIFSMYWYLSTWRRIPEVEHWWPTYYSKDFLHNSRRE